MPSIWVGRSATCCPQKALGMLYSIVVVADPSALLYLPYLVIRAILDGWQGFSWRAANKNGRGS